MRFRYFIESDDWWKGMTNTVKGVSPNTPIDSSGIYDMLTLRDRRSTLDKQYQQYNLASKEQDYQAVVNSLLTTLSQQGFQVSKSSWIHVHIPFQKNYSSNYDQAPVEAFKVYRTFVPEPDNRVSKFIGSLSGFAQELKQIQDVDPNYPDRIQFKFPARLQDFFYHPDSLVVHWRNKFNRDRINQAIDNYFSKAGVRFSPRAVRATQGYDMKAQGTFMGGSHSELISQALEKLINQNPQARQLPEAKLQPWLQQWIAHFNSLSPQAMHQYLTT